MQAPPVSHDGGVREDEAGLHVSFVGYSMAGILALAAIWITVFSASPGILPQPNPVYDFIVVGSGTAGSVLAAKLANGTDFRVLLMEAGEEEPWVSKLPLSTLMLQGSKYDWKYYTETQEFSSYGMLNKKSYWPRGMMLGGCAQLNYNIFSLGWREHYDRWVEQHRLEGWASEDLMQHVRELFCFPEQTGDTKQHHTKTVISSDGAWSDGEECGGETMPLSRLTSDMSNAFASAAQELQSSSHESSIQLGQMVTVNEGQRWSTLTNFLKPAMQSRSLHVVIQAHVDKILFDGTRAVGVQWHQWGAAKNVRQTFVRGEVILAAGVVNSPTILLQSGVGRREELEELEIPMVMDTPGAGLNLVDQMNLPVYVHLNSSMSINPAKLFTVQNFWKYFVSGDGLFADTGIGGILTEFPGAENLPEKDNKQDSSTNTAQIFEPQDQDLNEKITDGINDEIPANSSASDENNTLREKVEPGNPTTDWGSGKSPVGLLMFNMGSVERESYAKAANLALEVFDRAYPDMQNSSKEGVFLLASCLQPHSRGHVKQTQELRRQPSIQPNYLSDHRDVQCMKDSFRLLERFVETPTMQRIGASVHYPQLLRCSETKSTPTHHHSSEDETAREISINDHGNGEDNERRLPENASPLTGLTDEEIECVIRTLAFTGYHPIGTLKMGSLDDKEAVVDLQLRVRGVEGVRVMDASVLPSHTTPAPAALVALYAARTAYLIKKTWSPIAKVRGVEPCYEAVCGEDLYYTSSSGTPLYSLPILVLPYLVRCVTRCP